MIRHTHLAFAFLLLLAPGCASAPPASPSQERPWAGPPKQGEPFYALPDQLQGGAPVVDGGESGLAREATPAGEAPAVDLTLAEFAIRRPALEAFIKQGPRHVLQLVQVQPAFSGQRFVGYEVMQVSPDAAAWLKERLRVGDVVVSVNQQSVARPEDYMSIWGELHAQRALTISILRGGEALELVWPIIQ
jgi:hypothetical protein